MSLPEKWAWDLADMGWILYCWVKSLYKGQCHEYYYIAISGQEAQVYTIINLLCKIQAPQPKVYKIVAKFYIINKKHAKCTKKEST